MMILKIKYNSWVLFFLMVASVCILNNQTYSQNGAQEAPKKFYEFIRYGKNLLSGCDTSENYNHFLQLFDSLLHHKNFQVNIVHFGGSHIQADVYSNYVREKFMTIDSLLPGARGMIFPFKMAGTNNPSNYKIDYTGKWQGYRNSINAHQATWGVTGITVSTKDTLASMNISLKQNGIRPSFSSVRVFHNAMNPVYKIMLKDSSLLRKSIVNKAEDYTLIDLKYPIDSLELIIRKTKADSSSFDLYGILLENNLPGIVYHSIGVNGASFKSFLRCEKLQQQLKYLHPDLVIIAIGTNDTFDPDFDTLKFATRYDSLLTLIRNVNPNAAFLLSVPNDSYFNKKEYNKNTVLAEKIINKIADRNGYKVWNFYRIMGGKYSAPEWLKAGLMKPDLIHFTTEGYLLKGQLFFDAFMWDYWKWLEMKYAKTEHE
jgi:lysophospholipase L1-like esterase